MKTSIKYIIGLVVSGIVLYNSIYIQPLDIKLAEDKEIEFDAKLFVDTFWSNELLGAYNSAADLTQLLSQLSQDPDLTFENEAQALGIGNIGYFRVEGEGTVLRVNENDVWVQVENQTIEIETEFIYGNAIRDASGLIQLNDYNKTSDFNSISEAINDKIRKEVVPTFKDQVLVGNKVQFKGALELNKAHLDLSQPEIMPLFLQLIP